jgi:short-subunit dehydrogenase
MKKVIITGASSGIGEALANEYASKGYALGLIARRLDRLQAIKDRLAEQGTVVAIRALDVTDDQQILPTMESIADELGGIDIVIANAGITAVHRTGKDDFEINRQVIQINLISAMATVDAAAHLFRRNQSSHGKSMGQIVGVSSVSAFRGIPGSAAYSGSKAGFSNYLGAVRMELKNKGISVTTVHPGFVATELADNMEKYPFVITAEKAAKAIVSGITKKEANVIVPKLPWSALSKLITLVPDSLVSKVF